MIGFWDVIRRSEKGPLVKEKEFDLRVGQVARQMVEKYNIKYDPQNVIPADDGLADRIHDLRGMAFKCTNDRIGPEQKDARIPENRPRFDQTRGPLAVRFLQEAKQGLRAGPLGGFGQLQVSIPGFRPVRMYTESHQTAGLHLRKRERDGGPEGFRIRDQMI